MCHAGAQPHGRPFGKIFAPAVRMFTCRRKRVEIIRIACRVNRLVGRRELDYEQHREQIEAPFRKQETTHSCVPSCLRMVPAGFGLDLTEERLREPCDSTVEKPESLLLGERPSNFLSFDPRERRLAHSRRVLRQEPPASFRANLGECHLD